MDIIEVTFKENYGAGAESTVTMTVQEFLDLLATKLPFEKPCLVVCCCECGEVLRGEAEEKNDD